VLAPTHDCTTANDVSVNDSLYAPQRLENFPSPPWDPMGKWLMRLI